MDDARPEGRAKGGVARAESLPPDRRKEIAQKAAEARWSVKLPQATHEAPMNLMDVEIYAAVLSDGRRLLMSRDFLTALGRPWKGSYRRTRFPSFIDAANLSPYIPNALQDVLEPVDFRTRRGQKAVGYRAELLPEVINVYLRAREAGKLKGHRQKEIAARAEILARGLMRLGIIGLVDEATGYQADRAKDALAKILEEFIAKELRPWVRTFPDEFYHHLFRLRGLEFPKDIVKRPQYFGHLTNDIIYRRLAPGVLQELQKVVPKTASGRRAHPFTRRLTDDLGHPRLREHLSAVVTVMKLSDKYDDFIGKLDRTHPRFGGNYELPFDDQSTHGL